MRLWASTLFSAFLIPVLLLVGCAYESHGDQRSDPGSASGQIYQANENDSDEGEKIFEGNSAEAVADIATSEGGEKDSDQNVEYPLGWLVHECDNMAIGTPVRILSLPGIEVSGHDGEPETRAAISAKLEKEKDLAADGAAIVESEGQLFEVDSEFLMINLPDILSDATYDVVYSYASTSNCDGYRLPGVTGERLNGYADGKQENRYLGRNEFIVPCAYATALKVMDVEAALEEEGYSLLVYDAYRPMTAQRQLSESFLEAFETSDIVRESIGEWSLDWYVASGPSGHNFGTDVDVGLCNLGGTVLEMPSEFDAFDERGHLVDHPMGGSDIHQDLYRESVKANDACMTLHRAFVNAGFTELASEWWHFADKETESRIRLMVGDDGLDFIANCVQDDLSR